jgi:mRNA interferase MazF
LGIVEVTRGDVVLMVVPSDLGRPRPGIVVQADELPPDLSTILICPISSDLQEWRLLRPLIEVRPENGLRLPSQIMTDKSVALRRDQIRRVIGHIDRETSEQLDRALLVVLGLARWRSIAEGTPSFCYRFCRIARVLSCGNSAITDMQPAHRYPLAFVLIRIAR